VVDPLTAKETSARALEFAFKHLEKKPITAGILSPEEANAGKVRIIAPRGFMEEAVSENIIAGTGWRIRRNHAALPARN